MNTTDVETRSLVVLPSDGLEAWNLQQARRYADSAQSKSTKQAYLSAWVAFDLWCTMRGLAALPAHPYTLAQYLSEMATSLRVVTLEKHLAAIALVHRRAGYDPPPTASVPVREVLKGIRREHGMSQKTAAPLLDTEVALATRSLPDTLRGLRDRALLLFGFAAALRRSELVALQVDDLERGPLGITVHIRRAKTDQEGRGDVVGVPWGKYPESCPVFAVETWLGAAGVADGPLLRAVNRHGSVGALLSTKTVVRVVKNAAVACGYDAEAYSGHSLRRGWATAAARAGVEERRIMRHLRHKTSKMTRRYVEEGALFNDHPQERLDL